MGSFEGMYELRMSRALDAERRCYAPAGWLYPHGVALHPNVAAAVKALALRWSVALPKSFDGIDATRAPQNMYVRKDELHT